MDASLQPLATGFDNVQAIQNARVQALTPQRGQDAQGPALTGQVPVPSTRVNISETGRAMNGTPAPQESTTQTVARADSINTDRIQGRDGAFHNREAVQRYVENLPAGQSAPSTVRVSA